MSNNTHNISSASAGDVSIFTARRTARKRGILRYIYNSVPLQCHTLASYKNGRTYHTKLLSPVSRTIILAFSYQIAKSRQKHPFAGVKPGFQFPLPELTARVDG